MDPERRGLVPEHFPEELLDTAYSLEHLLINGMAWSHEDAIKAVHAFADANYAILGGDVYKKEHDSLVSTSDSWFLNQGELSWEDYVEESRKKALSYIEMLYRRHGNIFYYAPVAADEGRENRRMTS